MSARQAQSTSWQSISARPARRLAYSRPKARNIAFEFEPTQVWLLPNGGAEQDPAEWWSAIKKATARLVAKAASFDASRWPPYVALHSGPARWPSTRRTAADECNHLDGRARRQVRRSDHRRAAQNRGLRDRKSLKWIRLTGGVPTHSGKDPIAHILFIKNERPEIYRKTCKFLEPKDYLNLRPNR